MKKIFIALLMIPILTLTAVGASIVSSPTITNVQSDFSNGGSLLEAVNGDVIFQFNTEISGNTYFSTVTFISFENNILTVGNNTNYNVNNNQRFNTSAGTSIGGTQKVIHSENDSTWEFDLSNSTTSTIDFTLETLHTDLEQGGNYFAPVETLTLFITESTLDIISGLDNYNHVETITYPVNLYNISNEVSITLDSFDNYMLNYTISDDYLGEQIYLYVYRLNGGGAIRTQIETIDLNVGAAGSYTLDLSDTAFTEMHGTVYFEIHTNTERLETRAIHNNTLNALPAGTVLKTVLLTQDNNTFIEFIYGGYDENNQTIMVSTNVSGASGGMLDFDVRFKVNGETVELASYTSSTTVVRNISVPTNEDFTFEIEVDDYASMASFQRLEYNYFYDYDWGDAFWRVGNANMGNYMFADFTVSAEDRYLQTFIPYYIRFNDDFNNIDLSVEFYDSSDNLITTYLYGDFVFGNYRTNINVPISAARARVIIPTETITPVVGEVIELLNNNFQMNFNNAMFTGHIVEVNYDSALGSVSGAGEYYAGDEVTITYTEGSGYFFGWESTYEPLNGLEDASITFIMPNEPITLTAVEASSRFPNRVHFSMAITGSRLNPQVSHNIDPMYFTEDRLRYAHIAVNGDFYVWDGYPEDTVRFRYEHNNPANMFSLMQRLDYSGNTAIATVDLFYNNYSYGEVDYEQGDFYIFGSANSFLEYDGMVIDIYLIIEDVNRGISAPTRGENTLSPNIEQTLAMWGFNNDIGFMILLLAAVFIVTIALSLVKMPAIVIIIVDIAIISVWIAYSLIPIWATLIAVFIIILGIVISLKGGMTDGV